MGKHQNQPPQHDIFGPGWGSDERPDLVTRGDSGHTAFWFRPQSVKPPSRYDVGVPHRSKSGWMVYILFLVLVAMVGSCLIGCALYL